MLASCKLRSLTRNNIFFTRKFNVICCIANICRIIKLQELQEFCSSIIYPMEQHPFKPFLPVNARILFLGSFPPTSKRWSIPFYYPNWQNDMWRMVGLLFYGDKDYFCLIPQKKYNQPLLEDFLNERGIALSDTAQAVTRLKGNASDKFLQIDVPMDLSGHLRAMPQCDTIVVTGEKAGGEFLSIFPQVEALPAVGQSVTFPFGDRQIQLFRMPSTSRAYPRPLQYKADLYRKAFESAGLL